MGEEKFGEIMKIVNIKDKLKQIECSVESISLGDFDQIGEYTAKKARNRGDQLYNSVGCFFRPNYERGILLSALVKRFECKSFLEIGFGRGYSSFCVAKTMCDMGWNDAQVYSIDVKFDEDYLKQLLNVFPREWFEKINLIKGTSDALFAQDLNDKIFDLIYIDGDHTYDAVLNDWKNVKSKYTKFVLFDDYDNKKVDINASINVKRLVDEIELDKELIITDRRIFFDDRRIEDCDVNYGQVLIKNGTFDDSAYLTTW